MQALNWADFVIIGIIAISSFVSLLRGFVREAISLAVWVFAFWVAWTFFREVSLHVTFVQTPSMKMGLAFIGLFLVTVILGGLISFLMGQLVEMTGLSGTDRILGMFFGAARGALLVTIIVLLAGLTPFPEDPWWQQSQLIPHLSELATWLRDLLPPEFADKFRYT